MYLNDYGCHRDRNLGEDAPAGLHWDEVTYLPKTIEVGQDWTTIPPSYFDPDSTWLAAIGFTGDPMKGRHEIKVPMVQSGYGEQASMVPGPLPDGWLYVPGGWDVHGSAPAVALWTPVRQWEKDKGYRQQVAWKGTDRYGRYVDSSGKQIGPVVRTYKESKATKILGKAVQIVAGAMVAAGAVQAAAAVASAASGAGSGAGATATKAAGTAATSAVPAAAAPAAAVAPAAAAVAPAVVAPSVAAGGGLISTITGAASAALPVIAKAAPVVGTIVKAVSPSKPPPVAPPAPLIQQTQPIPANALVPVSREPVYDPTIFGSSMPPWFIPALIGGGALLLMAGRRRSKR